MYDVPVDLGEYVCVGLVADRAVVLMVVRQLHGVQRVAYPQQIAEVLTYVMRACYAHLCLQDVAGVLGGQQCTGIMVVELLAVDAIGFFHFVAGIVGVRQQSEVFECFILVLLVVSTAVGVMRCSG